MKKMIMLAVIASVILASCKKETNRSTPTTAKNELGVSAAGISGTINTRAMRDLTAFGDQDKIAVFLADGIGGIFYTPKVAEYTLNAPPLPNPGWTSPSDVTGKIYLSNRKAYVYGFYPSTSTVTTGTLGDNATIDIALSNTEASFYGAGQNDYMYAVSSYLAGETGVSNKTGAETVNLTFKHAFAKITFVVNKGQYYPGAGALTSVKLAKVGSFNAGAGTMAVKDGALNWGATPVMADFLLFTTDPGAIINTYNATASTTPVVKALVAPRDDNTGTLLTLIVDGKEMSVTLPISATDPYVGKKWEAGNNYTYVITVNPSELVVGSQVFIADWAQNGVGGADVN